MVRIKEAEDKEEAETSKEAEAESEAMIDHKPKGARYKEVEGVDESDEAEDKDDKDKEAEAKKKKKKEAKKDAESEDEDEDKKDKLEKEEGEASSGENPEQDTASATQAGSTVTPGAVTRQGQNVFVPNSGIKGDRMATGNSASPSNISYSGKSVSPELMKSPLFVELSKHLGELDKTIATRMTAIEKSVADRIGNISKSIAKIEEFYKQPFYKAINEANAPEAVQKQTFREQVEKGKIKYSD